MSPTSSLRYLLIFNFCTVFVPHPANAQSMLDGTYAALADESARIDAAIEQAVATMNFIKRPIARSRLKKTNPAYRSIAIATSDGQITVTFDERKPVAMPSGGTTVKWTRDDGEVLDVGATIEATTLKQTFKAEDGQRLNTFVLAPDGRALTLEVTITSEQLPTPLRYSLTYRRTR